MDSSAEIEHTGVVHQIGNGTVTVRVTTNPSCESCVAASLCSASDEKDKYFEFQSDNRFAVGQHVRIITSLNTGFRALAIGYLIPLAVLLFTLILLISIGTAEVWSGIGSLIAVAAYYASVYLFREKINRKIKFTLIPA